MASHFSVICDVDGVFDEFFCQYYPLPCDVLVVFALHVPRTTSIDTEWYVEVLFLLGITLCN